MANEKNPAETPKALPKTVILFRSPSDNPKSDYLYIAQTPDEVLERFCVKGGVSAAIYELKKNIFITREIKVTEQENGRSRKSN